MLRETIQVEMFYLNTFEQLFLFVEQVDQLEVCLPYSRLLAGIPILAVLKILGGIQIKHLYNFYSKKFIIKWM